MARKSAKAKAADAKAADRAAKSIEKAAKPEQDDRGVRELVKAAKLLVSNGAEVSEACEKLNITPMNYWKYQS